MQMTRKLKDLNSYSQSVKSPSLRSQATASDKKLLYQVEQLKQHLSLQKERVDEKRNVLSDQLKHLLSFK